MLRKNIALVATVLVTVLGLSACDAAESDPTTPTTGVAHESPTTVAGEPVGHDLADGEMFAWVRGLTGAGLTIDPAELLSGEEARRAAVEAGVIEEGEDLPNDFFILDESEETSVVPIADGADLVLLLFEDGSPTETPVDYDEFVAALDGSNPDVYGVMDGVIPAMIIIEGGELVSVVETYLP